MNLYLCEHVNIENALFFLFILLILRGGVEKSSFKVHNVHSPHFYWLSYRVNAKRGQISDHYYPIYERAEVLNKMQILSYFHSDLITTIEQIYK